jgi:flagellar protein FlgJ
VNPVGPLPPQPAASDRARLRQASHDLEGVFLNQLFQAMRATVPHEGIVAQSGGEDLFDSMLDQRLSELSAARSTRGLGEALYRQLSRHLPAGPSTRTGTKE